MDAIAVMEATAPPAVRKTLAWPARMLLVLSLAALLFFARLGERAFWSEEMRWAQIPREMLRSENYLLPTINGKTYYDKPLGSYWLLLLASVFTGEVNETAARLPSAVFGLLGVALAMLIARRLYDDDAAVWTGVILATSFSFVFFARTASTDVETVTGVLAALWVFLRNEARPPGWWTFGFWLVIALTSLTKGLLGFVLPMLIVGVYSTLGPMPPIRQWPAAFLARNRWFFNRVSLLAIPLATLVYLAPFLLSILTTGSTEGLEMVYRENIRRFFDPVNHRGPIYLYGYVIFLLLAPWSLLLPAALAHAHGSTEKQDRGRSFALAYFWGTFVFFTLSSSRRSYYLLPILPAAAFLIARMLAQRDTLSRTTYGLLLTGFFLSGLAVLMSGLALSPPAWLLPAPWNELPELPCPAAFLLMWLTSLAAVGFTLVKLSAKRIAWSFFVIAFSLMAYLYLGALPAIETYRTQKPFANAAKDHLGTDVDRLALYRTREIVYYLDQPAPIAEYHTRAELLEAIDARSLRWIVVRRRDWEGLRTDGIIVLAEATHPWEDTHEADGKLLLVEVR